MVASPCSALARLIRALRPPCWAARGTGRPAQDPGLWEVLSPWLGAVLGLHGGARVGVKGWEEPVGSRVSEGMWGEQALETLRVGPGWGWQGRRLHSPGPVPGPWDPSGGRGHGPGLTTPALSCTAEGRHTLRAASNSSDAVCEDRTPPANQPGGTRGASARPSTTQPSTTWTLTSQPPTSAPTEPPRGKNTRPHPTGPSPVGVGLGGRVG